MRQIGILTLCLSGAVMLSACGDTPRKGDVNRALQNVNVVDESNLNDIMLTVADPNEAVAYFQRATKDQPKRTDLQRGLATSLVRAKRAPEAVTAFNKLLKMDGSTLDDQVDMADALIRAGDWKAPRPALTRCRPPTRPSNATGSRRWSPTATRNGRRPTVSMKLPWA